MNLSEIDRALLLATYFRGNTLNQDIWTSSCDQVVTLSLFYTGDINSGECESRFSNRGYVSGLYQDDGELHPYIETRYRHLIKLLLQYPKYIEGGGDFDTPADPTFTACRLTDMGVGLIPTIIKQFPCKPEFANWSDKRSWSNNV